MSELNWIDGYFEVSVQDHWVITTCLIKLPFKLPTRDF